MQQATHRIHSLAGTAARGRTYNREVYDRELDDEVEAYIHGAPCEEDAFPVRLYDCVAPEVPWTDDARWIYAGTLSCDEGDLVGGIGPSQAPRSIRSRTIEIPESRGYKVHLESDAEGEVIVQIGACFGCPWEHRNYRVEPGTTITPALDAGRYYVRIQGDSAMTTTVQLEIEPDLHGGA